MMNRIIALLTLLCCVLLPAGGASAHAIMTGSTPESGTVLTVSPPVVEVHFNEPVEAEFTPVLVRDQRGNRVDAGDATVDKVNPAIVRVSLPPLDSGFYTAVYRVTSLDGHLIQGNVAFTVGTPAGEAPEATPEPDATVVPPATGLAKGLSQWVAVILAGLTSFLTFAWWPTAGARGSKRVRRWAVLLPLLLTVVGLTELALYAVRASGEGLSVPLMSFAITQTRAGQLWLTRTLLGAASGLALAMAHKARPGFLRGLALLPGAGLLLTYSLQSHAIAMQETLPVAADWLHLLGLAPWAGGLLAFAAIILPELSGKEPAERAALLKQAVPRFSVLAVIALLILTVTGVYSAMLHVPSWEALYTTSYGRALLIKLALFLPLLALGAYNFRKTGAGLFKKAVVAEVILMAGMFAAVGFLTSLPPAQVEMELKRGPYQATMNTENLLISLEVAPNRVGFNKPTITVRQADGTPETGASVGLRVDMPIMDMGLQTLEATETGPGVFKGEEMILGMHGEWVVEVVILTKDGREVRQPFTVDVPYPVGGF